MTCVDIRPTTHVLLAALCPTGPHIPRPAMGYHSPSHMRILWTGKWPLQRDNCVLQHIHCASSWGVCGYSYLCMLKGVGLLLSKERAPLSLIRSPCSPRSLWFDPKQRSAPETGATASKAGNDLIPSRQLTLHPSVFSAPLKPE